MASAERLISQQTLHTLQRVILPTDADPEVLSLYIDADNWSQVGGNPVRLTNNNRIEDVLGRHKLRVRGGTTVSFASYFNAFPAAYWQRWTKITSVKLSVRTTGQGTVLLYRSNARGVVQRIDSALVSGTKTSTTSFELPLTNFIDGGWYWFDVIAGDTDLIFEGAEYTTDAPPLRKGKATVAITTFNRPDYCVKVIRALANDKGLKAVVDAVCVIDQGTHKVSSEKAFPAVARKLGERLKIISQPNLGGSGGFSRGMIEALASKDSDFVLLLDDDVVVEPEGINRSVTFGRYTYKPTIVGGHMFDMYDRAQIHSYSERVDRNRFFWEPKDWSQFRHNFASSNLRQTPWLHERADVDFNGWWMSLIPLDIVREIGLSLPVFIKWDDAEYSLRASDHGFATVSFPGSALWHVSWQDKDDYKDWQAYFHARNRAVAALLHSPHKKGGAFIRQSLLMSIKHLFKMQYFTDELYAMGIDDVLRGPGILHDVMAARLGDVRVAAQKFPETSVFRDSSQLPEPLIGSNDVPAGTRLSRLKLALWLVKYTPRQWVAANKAHTGVRPQVSLTSAQATWWTLAAYDSALVSTADGSGKQHYRRNASEFKHRLQATLKRHRKLRRSWPSLSAQYRTALGEITSVEAWKRTIGIK